MHAASQCAVLCADAPGWSTVQLYDEEVVQPPTDAGGAPLLNLDAWGDF